MLLPTMNITELTREVKRDYEKIRGRDVKFVRPPETFTYGTVAVFEDLYGNLWDLIEPNENNKGLIQSNTEQSTND